MFEQGVKAKVDEASLIGYEQYPLSPTQRNMAVSSLLHIRSGVYVQQALVDVAGKMDISFLRQAWEELTSRHQMLRTSIHLDSDGGPVLRVWPSCEVDFRERVLRAEGETEFEQILARDRVEEFDLAEAPLARLCVIRCGEDANNKVIITYHHSVIDGPSRRALIKELFQIYGHLCGGSADPPARAIPYSVFGDWLTECDLSSSNKYWQTQTALVGAANDIRGDRINPNLDVTGNICHQISSYVFSESDRDQIAAYSKASGVRIPLLFISAWCALLGRYNDRDKVAFGLIRGGRSRPGSDCSGVIGSLISAIPMGVDLSDVRRCQDLCDLVKSLVRETRDHEHSDLTQIRDALNIAQDQPLFNTILVINRDSDDDELSGSTAHFRIENVQIIERPDVPLFLQIYTEPQLRIRLYYDLSRYSAEFVEGILRHFRNLTLAICDRVADWQQAPLLDAWERARVIKQWNKTDKKYAHEQTIAGMFELQAAKTPDAVAVEDSVCRLTYRELNDRSSQLAGYLVREGIGPDQLVGIYLDRSVAMVVAMVGILKAGAAYLPLDPLFPSDRIQYMIKDSSSKLIITQSSLQGDIADTGNSRTICIDTDWLPMETGSGSSFLPKVSSNRMAYMIYTSGSTGRPKGVMVEHRNVINFFIGMDDRISHVPPGTWLAITSLSFDISVLELLYTICRGFKVVIHSSARNVADAAANTIGRLIREHGISHLQCTPSMASMILLDENDRNALKGISTLMIGGEMLPVSLARDLADATAANIINMYGPTETTIWSSTGVVDSTGPAISIGRPIANTQFYILDSNLQLVPPGVPGNLYIGGDGVTRGYFNQPELTRDRFIRNPIETTVGSRIYCTGDVACWTQVGCVDFLGRSDNQIKIRGYRVELGEIEAQLMEQKAVREAVVVSREYFNMDMRLTAYVIPAEGCSIDVDELRGALKEKLPTYMVPTQYFVLDAFPLTPNKKIDRKVLSLKAKDAEMADEHTIKAPRNQIEAQLLELWQEVLQIERIGLDDNFFDVGGHSLLAVDLISRVNHAFGRNLPAVTLFETPTIEGLAALLSVQDDGTRRSLVQVKSGSGEEVPLYLVHDVDGEAILYHSLANSLSKDRPVYVLRPFGTEQCPMVHSRIEDMAAHYVDEIKQVRSKGPYLLGGLCAGGVIAFEMACQLQDAGDEVPLVVIMDALEVTSSRLKRRWRQRLHRFLNSADKAGYEVGERKIERLDGVRMSTMLGKIKNVIVYEIGGIAKGLSDRFKVHLFARYMRQGKPLPSALRNLPVAMIYRVARKEYSPRTFRGRLALFRATQATQVVTPQFDDTPVRETTSDPSFGWDKRASCGVQIEDIPGGHSTMLQPPHVTVLADKIETSIRASLTS